jgi:hypothetical protein
MEIHFFREETDLFVDFANENGVHHEHDKVHETARMNVIDVEE